MGSRGNRSVLHVNSSSETAMEHRRVKKQNMMKNELGSRGNGGVLHVNSKSETAVEHRRGKKQIWKTKYDEKWIWQQRKWRCLTCKFEFGDSHGAVAQARHISVLIGIGRPDILVSLLVLGD